MACQVNNLFIRRLMNYLLIANLMNSQQSPSAWRNDSEQPHKGQPSPSRPRAGALGLRMVAVAPRRQACAGQHPEHWQDTASGPGSSLQMSRAAPEPFQPPPHKSFPHDSLSIVFSLCFYHWKSTPLSLDLTYTHRIRCHCIFSEGLLLAPS